MKKKNSSVSVPIANTKRWKASLPKISHQGDVTRVSKTEYISEVFGSATPFAKVLELGLNASLGTTFPWLSTMAVLYESYKFLKLNFHFQTEAPTTTPGYVVLVPQYDPHASPPGSKVSAMDHMDAQRTSSWCSTSLHCTKGNLNKRKSYFNRDEALLRGDADLDLYDVGTLSVCVGNQESSNPIGELWVDYEVEFSTPVLPNNDALRRSGFLGYEPVDLSTAISWDAAQQMIQLFGDKYNYTSGTTTIHSDQFTWNEEDGTPSQVLPYHLQFRLGNDTTHYPRIWCREQGTYLINSLAEFEMKGSSTIVDPPTLALSLGSFSGTAPSPDLYTSFSLIETPGSVLGYISFTAIVSFYETGGYLQMEPEDLSYSTDGISNTVQQIIVVAPFSRGLDQDSHKALYSLPGYRLKDFRKTQGQREHEFLLAKRFRSTSQPMLLPSDTRNGKLALEQARLPPQVEVQNAQYVMLKSSHVPGSKSSSSDTQMRAMR